MPSIFDIVIPTEEEIEERFSYTNKRVKRKYQ